MMRRKDASIFTAVALLLACSPAAGVIVHEDDSDYDTSWQSSGPARASAGLSADEVALKAQMEAMLQVLTKNQDAPPPASADSVFPAATPPSATISSASITDSIEAAPERNERTLRTSASEVLSSISQLLKEGESGSRDVVAASLVRDAGGSAADALAAKGSSGQKGQLSNLASNAARKMIDAELTRDEADEKKEKETVAKENNIISIATAAKHYAEAKLKNLHSTAGELKKEAAEVAKILKGLSDGAVTKGLNGAQADKADIAHSRASISSALESAASY